MPGLRSVAIYDRHLKLHWSRGAAPPPPLQEIVADTLRSARDARAAAVGAITASGVLDPAAAARAAKPQVADDTAARMTTLGPLSTGYALPFRAGDRMRGVCAVTLHGESGSISTPAPAQLAKILAPAMNCLGREFAEASEEKKRNETLTERTRELEWLIDISKGKDAGGGDNDELLLRLLRGAVKRMRCTIGAVLIPERQINLIAHRENEVDSNAHRVLGRIRASLLDAAHRQQRVVVVNRLTEANGAVMPYKVIAVPLLDSANHPSGIVLFMRPVEERDFERRHLYLCKHLSRQLSTLLARRFDLATGLHTRGALETYVRELMQTDPTCAEACVLHIDIDQLHLINERFGFDKGDQLIVHLAHTLKPPLLPADAVAARIAGDQFAIYLPRKSPEVAREIAESLAGAAHAAARSVFDGAADATLSVGIAELQNGAEGIARALALAELACKTAKDHGRNRVEIYLSGDNTMTRRFGDIAIVGRLREALKNDGFALYAQRIASLKHNVSDGYEVLLRVLEPDGSVTSPAPYVSAAQRYQLLNQLDDWVVRRAFQQASRFRGTLLQNRIGLSLNVSGPSLMDAGFWERIEKLLGESHMAPGLITFEITENVALTNLAQANALISRLKGRGCKFALDDFGVGVNSLSYLKSLPVNRVKIDGSFIRDILTNPRSEATVRAIVNLAREMRIETVAEYVESEAILKRVRLLGIDFAQGYAISEPQDLTEVLTGLEDERQREYARMQLEI